MNPADEPVDPDVGDEVGIDLVALPLADDPPQDGIEQAARTAQEASEPSGEALPFPSDAGLAGEPQEPLQEPLQQQPAAWPYPSTFAAPAVDPRAALVAFQRPQMPAPVSKSMVFAKLLRETDGGDRPSGLDRLRQRHRGAS